MTAIPSNAASNLGSILVPQARYLHFCNLKPPAKKPDPGQILMCADNSPDQADSPRPADSAEASDAVQLEDALGPTDTQPSPSAADKKPKPVNTKSNRAKPPAKVASPKSPRSPSRPTSPSERKTRAGQPAARLLAEHPLSCFWHMTCLITSKGFQDWLIY